MRDWKGEYYYGYISLRKRGDIITLITIDLFMLAYILLDMLYEKKNI
jgi:hypothetical protein